MKVGTQVAVCHDGKWGRRVSGTVVKQRNGHHIQVMFCLPGEDKPTLFWARRIPAQHGRWSRGHYWGGWANADYFMPYFSVHKWKD